MGKEGARVRRVRERGGYDGTRGGWLGTQHELNVQPLMAVVSSEAVLTLESLRLTSSPVLCGGSGGGGVNGGGVSKEKITEWPCNILTE